MLRRTCYGAINLKNQIATTDTTHYTDSPQPPGRGSEAELFALLHPCICHTIDACLLLYLEIPQLKTSPWRKKRSQAAALHYPLFNDYLYSRGII